MSYGRVGEGGREGGERSERVKRRRKIGERVMGLWKRVREA